MAGEQTASLKLNPMKLWLPFLGAPGAGKTTLAFLLRECCNFEHFYLGHLLAGEINSGSTLGQTMCSFTSRGRLIPDKLILPLASNALSKMGRKVILDGFPRSPSQVRFLEARKLEQNSIIQPVYFHVPTDVIFQRLASRRKCRCCGKVFGLRDELVLARNVCPECKVSLYQREEDQPDIVKLRIKEYSRNNRQVVAYYRNRNKLWQIDATLSPESVLESILARLRLHRLIQDNVVLTPVVKS